MPKHDQPHQPNTLTLPGDKKPKAQWLDLAHGPAKGQLQAKHSRPMRVPGKGSGR